MNILTRKCDICGTRHDNDTKQYWLYGRLIDVNGQESDVCPACMPARADAAN